MEATRYSRARDAALVAAFGFAGIAQLFVSQSPYDSRGWLFYAAALFLIVTSARRLTFTGPPHAGVDRRAGLRIQWAVISIVAVAAAAMLSVGERHPIVALVAWVAAMPAASLAVRGWRCSAARRECPWSRAERIAFAALIVLAALARFTWIDSLPARYFDDESRVGNYLLKIFRGGTPNFFDLGWNAWPTLGMAIQGALGPLVQLSTTSLRLTSAVFGTLAVAATYFAARQLFSARVAVLAALFLAINRTAIDFSRLGVCHAQVMLLAPLAFGFWWRGINTGAASSYLWAGIVMGLAFYSYNAGQLIFLSWAGWIALAFLLAYRASSRYRNGALLCAVAFSLTVLPLAARVTDGFRFAEEWEEWTSVGRQRQVVTELADRLQDNGVADAATYLGEQASATWLGFFALPSKAYELGYREGGLADDITAMLFLLGLALCVSGRFGARGAFVAWWWLVPTVLAGVLTRDQPVFARLVGLLPAVALLAALPLERLLRWDESSALKGALGVGMVVMLAIGAVWQNWQTYFVQYAQQPLDFTSMLARYVRSLPADQTVILSGPEYVWHPAGWQQHQFNFSNDLFALDFRGRTFQQLAEPAHLLPLRPPKPGPVAVVFGPTQRRQVASLLQVYPEARVEKIGQGNHVLVAATLPRAAVERWNGLRVRLGEHELGIADPFEALSLPDTESGQVLHWRGSLYWPQGRTVELLLTAEQLLEVRLAGASLPLTGTPRTVHVRVELPQGWHPFEVRQRAGSGRRPWSMSLRLGGLSREIGPEDFTPVTAPGGVLATYRQLDRIRVRALDPQLNVAVDERLFSRPYDLPIRMPFTVDWRGRLRIDEPGEYELELHTTGPAARISVGDDELFAIDNTPGGGRALVRRTRRRWEAGLYEIEATWHADFGDPPSVRRVFQLYWTPPGGVSQLIPPSQFERPVEPIRPTVLASQHRWCDDDCNRDGRWTVDELLTVVSIAAGTKPLIACTAADSSGDRLITVDEVVRASNKVLKGCH